MSIYAISDLHLSFNEDKPMDIFGSNWENHADKIRDNWIEKVNENDLVLLPGDLSWSLYLEDTQKDFEYLNNLPGKKIILKGNHDYWWSTISKMNKYLKDKKFDTINFLHNNSYEYEEYIITGTRGWGISELDKDDIKILKREVQRLKLSLEDGISKYGENKKIITCLHYPPLKEKESSDFVKLMKEYNVEKCIYGHLHGPSQKYVIEGLIDNIEYIMVSCDYTNFDLIKLV